MPEADSVTELSVHYSHIKMFGVLRNSLKKSIQVRDDATPFPVYVSFRGRDDVLFPFRVRKKFLMSSCTCPLLSDADREPEKWREERRRQTERENIHSSSSICAL